MNRHQKELRLAELKVSRDILNQQIEALQRELTTDSLENWKDRVEAPRCPCCFGTKTNPNLVDIAGVTRPIRMICPDAFHATNR